MTLWILFTEMNIKIDTLINSWSRELSDHNLDQYFWEFYPTLSIGIGK